ncbi:MAG TPA: sugar ABC transporter substrate-binding protein [Rhodospirillaceae bacterium]|nr:sugar ABC transporter substrate-binding protein [Rhodospirillaceae bacterium]
MNTDTLKLALCVCGLLPLAACSFFPASGPQSFNMDDLASLVVEPPKAQETVSGAPQEFKYALVDISRPVVDYLSLQDGERAFSGEWPVGAESKAIRIAVGDTVQVTIYESQSGGLFVPAESGVRPGNFVPIPAQTIDKSGTINIPFAGTISVVGRTPDSIAKEISEKLSDRAIEPQAVVSITARGGSEVSVIGEVGAPGRFSLSFEGEKILDAVARAGGPRFPGYETWATLQRKGREWSIPFELLVQKPENNIGLQPSDVVYLYREPELYQMFGASGFNGAFPFIKRDMTLAEAIGQSRGLADLQADPEEIYLYRLEKRAHLRSIGSQAVLPEGEKFANTIPVIYRLDLRNPEGYFFAQSFPVNDKDVIYIANARSVELTKFLDLIGLSSTTKIGTQDAVEQ